MKRILSSCVFLVGIIFDPEERRLCTAFSFPLPTTPPRSLPFRRVFSLISKHRLSKCCTPKCPTSLSSPLEGFEQLIFQLWEEKASKGGTLGRDFWGTLCVGQAWLSPSLCQEQKATIVPLKGCPGYLPLGFSFALSNYVPVWPKGHLLMPGSLGWENWSLYKPSGACVSQSPTFCGDLGRTWTLVMVQKKVPGAHAFAFLGTN